MVKRKYVVLLCTIFVLVLLGIRYVHARTEQLSNWSPLSEHLNTRITLNSNFFTQVDNQTPVELPDVQELTDLGYRKVSENDYLELYLEEKTLGIAVVDKTSQYIWYSTYKDYKNYITTGKLRYFIESGVSIEYYDSDTLNENSEYVSNPAANVEKELTYTDTGFIAAINFSKLGISFSVEVTIEGKDLYATVLHDTIVEVPYQSKAMKYPKEYKLKAIYLFPYFGSQNYMINGYSFIPDGSGALIRYTNVPSSTAYIKRVYGQDLGILNNPTIYDHLKAEMPITLPIFGVNHGYQQAAFLAEIVSGKGHAEIHSYPYYYNNIPFNTTFAKDIVRDKFVVQMSTAEGGGMPIINASPYPSNFTVRYSFLSGNEANYIGMAKKYKERLELKSTPKRKDIPLKLDLIGVDYKPGLFGKTYIAMTTYKDVISIVESLKGSNEAHLGIPSLELVYLSWNKGGFYNNSPVQPKAEGRLGGKDGFKEMMNYLDDQGITIFFYNDPILSFNTSYRQNVVKKINLSLMTAPSKSRLFNQIYYRSYRKIADSVLKYEKNYRSLAIDHMVFDSLGSTLYSYIENSKPYYRDQGIEIIRSEMEKLSNFNFAFYQPNDYLLSYTSRYYNAPFESNKYSFITDSVPFISLVLSGEIDLYSDYLNFVSDYDLMVLRLIEYNIYPSFIVTKKPTHHLRYSNYEYIYTSEFALWEEEIRSIYHQVNDVLRHVVGEEMVGHRYISEQVACVTYSNGVSIYVNYSDEPYEVDGHLIPAKGTLVEEGKDAS